MSGGEIRSHATPESGKLFMCGGVEGRPCSGKTQSNVDYPCREVAVMPEGQVYARIGGTQQNGESMHCSCDTLVETEAPLSSCCLSWVYSCPSNSHVKVLTVGAREDDWFWSSAT